MDNNEEKNITDDLVKSDEITKVENKDEFFKADENKDIDINKDNKANESGSPYIDMNLDEKQNDKAVNQDNIPEYMKGYKNLYADNYKFDNIYVPKVEIKEQNTQKKKPKRGPFVALVAVLVIVALAVGSVVGFSGAMLTYEQMSAAGVADDTTANLSIAQSNSSELNIGYSEEDILNRNLTVVQTTQLVKDSVVEITTEMAVTSDYGSAIVSGAGSGVIIDENGYIVTNNHVIDGASTIKVRLTNGNEYDATLVGTDATSDVALISIQPEEDLTVAIFGDSSDIVLGETVIAVGNPLGEFGGTVTDGIISALERHVIIEDQEMTLIQTNAAVSPGNSGGGLFNMAGELIGIVNAKSVENYVEGLAFAIPVNTVQTVITELGEYGYVKGQIDTTLGLSLWDTNSWGSYYVCIIKDNGDFKKNDVIVAIDGVEVSTTSNIASLLRDKKIGDTVEVTVARGNWNNEKTYTVTIPEYVPSTVNFG